MQAKIKLLSYAPDADPTIPGTIVDCAQIYPTVRGFKAAASPVSTSLPALASACQGASVVIKNDNTTRFIVGTGTALYEDNSTAWTTVTRASGGAYNAAADVRWSFAQFNNTTLAALKSDTLQFSTSTGAFANVTGAPMAAIVETVNEFVFLFNTNEGIYGDSPNRWWCAAQGGFTDWTPSINTNCYTGTLFSSPGKIKAGKRFGDNIIAYKDNSMFIGYFAGSPTGWKFSEIPGSTGALSNEVVVNVGTPENPKHIFMGNNDFYSYDGSRPIPLGSLVVKQNVFNALNRTFAHCCIALHDIVGSRIFFYYPTSSSVNPDKCVIYNYKTNTWGRDDRTIEAAVGYVANGVTYDTLGSTYATYDDLSMNTSYDTTLLYAGSPTNAIFDTTHTVKKLTGIATTSSITLGDYGDDSIYYMFKRLKPRYVLQPTSANMVNFYRYNLGDSLTLDTTSGQINGRFDVLREARWHRPRLDFTGDMEISDVVIEGEQGGLE